MIRHDKGREAREDPGIWNLESLVYYYSSGLEGAWLRKRASRLHLPSCREAFTVPRPDKGISYVHGASEKPLISLTIPEVIASAAARLPNHVYVSNRR